MTQAPSHDYVARLRGVTKQYRMGDVTVHALKGIDLDIRRQVFSFIIGPSGSGKTTLLNLLGCIDTPSHGELLILDRNVGEFSDDGMSDFRNGHIGYIFQNFNLISVLSAYENVEYPLLLKKMPRSERRDTVMGMLEAVGLADRAGHRPNQMSGGERQRVAIARALAKQPAMVLADEPTANLDSRTSQEIIELMLDVQARYRTTFIFSTHDQQVMKYADETVVIQDGLLTRH
jgi:putative ABC transport system ATP-binding protein